MSVSVVVALVAGCSTGEAGRPPPGLGKSGDSVRPGYGDAGWRRVQTLEAGHGAKVPNVEESTGRAPCVDAGARDAAISPECADPRLGVVGRFVPEIVSFTGTVVNGCLAGNRLPCSGGAGTFMAPADVALDYGDFPFSRDQSGEYFFAVVARGYEDAGFLDGAAGNLSDAVASSVEGDRGSGDTLADRTIVVSAAQVVKLFPASHGSHEISVPPSQFVTIHLAPFDTTPSGSYSLAVCRMGATSRCDCAFDTFTIVHRLVDAGLPGAGGASARGGAGGDSGVESRDSSVGDARSAGGSSANPGSSCHDM